MTIQNLKEFSKLIDLCRKKGIDHIKIDNIEFKLGAIPKKDNKAPELVHEASYSPEDVLFFSSQAISEVG